MHKWLPLEAFYFSLSLQALAFLDHLPFNATKMLPNNACYTTVIVPQIEFYSCACTVRLQKRKFDEVDCVQKNISE